MYPHFKARHASHAAINKGAMMQETMVSLEEFCILSICHVLNGLVEKRAQYS